MANETTELQGLIDRIQAGDESARDELIQCACERLHRIARKELKRHAKLTRWEDTGDVAQNASLRLWQALKTVKPQSVRHFLNLAGMHIRLELLDLIRHHFGPEGFAANYESGADTRVSESQTPRPAYDRADTTYDPSHLAKLTEIHDTIGRLPEEYRELFHLLHYQEMTQAEAARALEIPERTVRRRWQLARLKLREMMQGEMPT